MVINMKRLDQSTKFLENYVKVAQDLHHSNSSISFQINGTIINHLIENDITEWLCL